MMNMLGIAVLDFIDHLRHSTKGWQIEPMVLHYNYSNYIQLLRPSVGSDRLSPTEFFIDRISNPFMVTDEICYIKIKSRKKSLRFIQCKIEDCGLVLSYWIAEGWKQTGNTRHQVFRPNIGPVFRLYKIIRVTKGRRNRGRKSPGSSSVTHIDKVILNDPTSAGRVARMTVATIMKSYETTALKASFWRTRAIVLDGADFDFITAYGLYGLGVGAVPVYYS